jgi:hypothetical protein
MSTQPVKTSLIPGSGIGNDFADLNKVQPKPNVSDFDRIQFESEVNQVDPVQIPSINLVDLQQEQAALDTESKIKTSPGDDILQTVQGVRDQYMQIENNLKSLTSKGSDLSSADLMQLQFEVMQLSYMNELSSKAVDKTNNIAQTLMRNQ